MKQNINKIYAEALYSALENKKESQIGAIISEFLKVIKQKGLLGRMDKILREFEKIYNQKNNIAVLKIKSAAPLDGATVGKIAAKLGIKNYEVELTEDKNILGGAMVKFGDTMIDMSLKNYLNKLKQSLC